MTRLMARLGPYELQGEIARGGMAVVLRGAAPDGRPVAIKLLMVLEERHRRRLAREVGALRRLRHPHIVAIHEVGEDGGRPYLVLDLIEGESLEHRLARTGPLPPNEAAAIALALARALDHAHGEGVLHRDMKPANVLLSRDGAPFLTDFGLATSLGESLDQSRLTRSGTFLGSPGYWAPEQARGDLAQVGPAADVYGAGATLFAALTGRPPIIGESVMAVLAATEHERPPAPSSLRPEVDAALDAIVLGCLEKDPARRPASAGQLAASLEGWLATHGRRPRRRGTPSRPARRRLLGALAAAAAVTVVVGALALLNAGSGTWGGGGSGRDPPSGVAGDDRGAAAEAAAIASDALGLIRKGELKAAERELERLLSLDPTAPLAHLVRGSLDFAHGDTAKGLVELERAALRLPSDPRPWITMSAVRLDGGDLDGAMDAVERALSLEPDRPTGLLRRAQIHLRRERWDLVRRDLERVLSVAPNDAEAHNMWGALLVEEGDLRGALRAFDTAEALGYEFAVNLLVNRSIVHERLGDLPRARQDLERARTLDPRAGFLRREAARLRVLEDPAGALVDADAALSIDPDDDGAHLVRGQALSLLGRPAEALAALDRSLALKKEYVAYLTRARVHAERNEHARAIDDCTRAMELRPGGYEALTNRALCHLAAGDLDRALEDLDAADQRAPGDVQVLRNRALVYTRRNELDLAIADLDVIASKVGDDPQLLAQRGLLHAQLNDMAKALEDWDRALALAPADRETRRRRAIARRLRRDHEGAIADLDVLLEQLPASDPTRQELLLERDDLRAELDARAR